MKIVKKLSLIFSIGIILFLSLFQTPMLYLTTIDGGGGPSYVIVNGYVKNYFGGAGIANVGVSLSGTGGNSAITSSTGEYSTFVYASNWFTVSASLSGWLTTNNNIRFYSGSNTPINGPTFYITNEFYLSGTILNVDSGSQLTNVPVTISVYKWINASSQFSFVNSTTTNTGSYNIGVPSSQGDVNTYNVSLSFPSGYLIGKGYSSSYQISNNPGFYTQNFYLTNMVHVSGYVQDTSIYQNPVSGADIKILTNSSQLLEDTTSNVDGSYSLVVSSNQNQNSIYMINVTDGNNANSIFYVNASVGYYNQNLSIDIMVGYYQFENDLLDSGSNHLNSVYSQNIQYQPGIFNQMANFQANSMIILPDSSLFKSNIGTISAWVNTTTGGVIFSGALNTTNNYYLNLMIENGMMVFESNNGQAINKVSSDVNTIQNGKWHLLVWQTNGTEWTGYVDGQQVNLTVQSGVNSGQWFGALPNSNTFSIGFENGLTNSGFYQGNLDELKVFNDNEIIDNLLKLPSPVPQELLNYNASLKTGPIDIATDHNNINQSPFYFEITLISCLNTNVGVNVPFEISYIDPNSSEEITLSGTMNNSYRNIPVADYITDFNVTILPNNYVDSFSFSSYVDPQNEIANILNNFGPSTNTQTTNLETLMMEEFITHSSYFTYNSINETYTMNSNYMNLTWAYHYSYSNGVDDPHFGMGLVGYVVGSYAGYVQAPNHNDTAYYYALLNQNPVVFNQSEIESGQFGSETIPVTKFWIGNNPYAYPGGTSPYYNTTPFYLSKTDFLKLWINMLIPTWYTNETPSNPGNMNYLDDLVNTVIIQAQSVHYNKIGDYVQGTISQMCTLVCWMIKAAINLVFGSSSTDTGPGNQYTPGDPSSPASPTSPDFPPTEPWVFTSIFHNANFTSLFTTVDQFVNLILEGAVANYFNTLKQNTLNYVQQFFTSSTDPNVIMESLGTVFSESLNYINENPNQRSLFNKIISIITTSALATNLGIILSNIVKKAEGSRNSELTIEEAGAPGLPVITAPVYPQAYFSDPYTIEVTPTVMYGAIIARFSLFLLNWNPIELINLIHDSGGNFVSEIWGEVMASVYLVDTGNLPLPIEKILPFVPAIPDYYIPSLDVFFEAKGYALSSTEAITTALTKAFSQIIDFSIGLDYGGISCYTMEDNKLIVMWLVTG